MAITSENAAGAVLAPDLGRRAGRELVLEHVFRPLVRVLVPLLARLRVPPSAVVLANLGAGLLAAAAVARGEFVMGALLLQLKTLLDNADGQLARASERVTLAGRYLDTVADFVVNVGLFAALAYVTSQPLLATAGLVALTLLLSVDYQLSELAREAYGLQSEDPAASGGRGERFLAGVYRAVFAPQDRLVRSLADRRLAAAVGPEPDPVRLGVARRASFDSLTLTVLANLGLTTQLFVLGACLVLDVPELYLWLALAALLLLVPLQLRRERLARRASRT